MTTLAPSESGAAPELFRALFERGPGLCLALLPDAPRYTIVAVSDAYARATMTRRAEIVGRGLFEVFPDNPDDAEATGVRNLAASLERVVRTRAADAMPVQKYDVRRPRDEGGAFQERYWSPVNTPVLGDDGQLTHIIHTVEDVTELVRVERAGRDALTKEEQRYRELFESAPDGIFVASSDGRYTDVNAAGRRLLGYSREELVGRSVKDLIVPSELPRQEKLRRRILEGGTEVEEWQLRHKDGTLVPVELSASALLDGHLLAFVRNITERKRTEEAQRASEARFSGIVSISFDAIISIDEAQRITLFNEGAERTFGYSQAEILGAPLEALLPERFRMSHREHARAFSRGQASSRRMGARGVEIVGLRKNGEEFPAEAAISKLEIAGQTLLTVSLRDVSEQKRVESQERLLAEIGEILVAAGSDRARLLTDVACAIVRQSADWCSVDVVHDGDVRRVRMVHKDPRMAAICDAIERFPVGREGGPVSQVVDAQDSLLMSEVTPEYLESIAHSAEHLQLMREFDPGSFIVVPLVARGQTLGTIGLGASRASRRFGAEDLRLAERVASRVALALDNARLYAALERAVCARDEVLGIVAHDLRNPLNAIVLHAQSLRRRQGGPERRDQTPMDLIHRSAMRMNALIQDLLDVARLEGGEKLAITKRAVPAASVLAEAVEHHQAMISTSARNLKVDVPAELPDVRADRARILQVLDNLLGNALKFSRGQITVAATPIDDAVLFSVADDGMGIAAEDLSRLFDRFWQAKSGHHGGAGLGLSIAKGIVDAHGGRMWVESTVGVGTTFYFALPIARPA